MNKPNPTPAAFDEFQARIQPLQTDINRALERLLPAAGQPPQRLHQAMRYSVIGGGKRIRPILVLAAGQALGIPPERLLGPACAVELIHAYSLIHDDLPAMDDDELRRGRPTCHIAYDEATAILAGDALHVLAFEILATDSRCADSAESQLAMLRCLTLAAGSGGMVGGQAIDLAAVEQQLNLEQLESMHRKKTGALIEASVLLPSHACTRVDESQRRHLREYARQIGLAFQIQDDILDAIADTETLGKAQGADQARNKPTYYSLLGLDGARKKLAETHRSALDSLAAFDQRADLLRQIADYIVQRGH